MERRYSERVQFFQFSGKDDVVPVWVFRKAYTETILGLLIDISEHGVQILTDKMSPPLTDTAQLIIHTSEMSNTQFITLQVKQLWSKADGALYFRTGFAFDGAIDLTAQIYRMRVARDAGREWLRCELAASYVNAVTSTEGEGALP